ncbi:enoyl-CoA hydratase/isomerase family protein [Marinobacter zhejiangensis]|uniref:3-hydroxyisobutyryl-CoA hydrolase n=1 Tax=Marinobacter zhejiangensis TaxID=488535 RepID=A0A1I4NDJ4_9GAMM|nr:enoyl-CoA hydratase/isomerase family protein [Marinobacter zhejiangensis]SFM13571.1 Enoyl-CoA hydratase/carnithine racemase [Marinobacter zhejiangensis]
MSSNAVVFEEWNVSGGRVAVARLNTPKSLNALSLEMIRLLTPKMQQWQQDDEVLAVWLEAEGDKAFCAGGDIVALYRDMIEPQPVGSDGGLGQAFFTEEYVLDQLIHTFGKPVVCWGHGIVMGGGIGLMAGASHRVVTERSMLAMPEAAIGLYPDVGAGWFLNRMPGRTGLFLGLTGARLNGADALFVGLADRFISHELKAGVIAGLQAADWQQASADGVVNQVLRQFERDSAAAKPESPVREHLDVINRLTDADSLEGIVAQLKAAGEGSDASEWLSKSTRSLGGASPTSQAVFWRHLTLARQMSLSEVFNLELGLSLKCLSKGEFAEGVRALLIDKDQQPRWRYPALNDIDPAWIEDFFL